VSTITKTGTIRKAVAEDLPGIVTLEKKCFPGPQAYTQRQLRHLLTKAHSTVLVEEDSGTIRGFIIVLYRTGSAIAGIETIDVDPTCHRQGIAHRLLAAAETEMRAHNIKRIRLEVSSQNTPALRLYEEAGYRKKEVLHNYYVFLHHGSRDAFRMVKDLE
jgi:ribosomal protein S18 acetylase RimI-like enzyme